MVKRILNFGIFKRKPKNKTRIKNLKAQSPRSLITNSMGFTPSPSNNNSIIKLMSGNRHRINVKVLIISLLPLDFVLKVLITKKSLLIHSPGKITVKI